jgi:hypothetical protein
MSQTIANETVLVAWRMPPQQSADGSWFATYRPVKLPRHIARAERDAGRCMIHDEDWGDGLFG